MAKLLEPGAACRKWPRKANAPVTIVEYMSMTCRIAPISTTIHSTRSRRSISTAARYASSSREFPFDPSAAAAFMLARCAPEGSISDGFHAVQAAEQWAAAQNGRDALLQLSKTRRFYTGELRACLTNQKLLDDVNAVMQ